MAFFDLPLDELKTYLPARTEPADFDAFWKSTLDEARYIPSQRDLRKSGLRTRRTRNLRCHLQRLRRTTHQRLVDPPCRGDTADRPYHVSSNSSATAADATSRLTGSSGQA